jgi:hypothetical protein
MEQAINDAKGIRIKFATHGDAWHFRLRLNTARKIDRLENKEVYAQGDAMYGRSVYDGLTARIQMLKDDTCWLRIERLDAKVYEVESLSLEADGQPVIPPPPPEGWAGMVTIQGQKHEAKSIRPSLLRRF